jgi:hypothetical protein
MSIIDNYREGIWNYMRDELKDDASTTEVGDVFCQWCLENVFDLSHDEAIDAQDMSGAYDYGIDAVIEIGLCVEKTIKVVQTKYETSHSWSEITKFVYDMKLILANKARTQDANNHSLESIVKIQDNYEKGQEVKFYYVTNSEFSETERAKISQLEGYNIIFFFIDIQDISRQLESLQEDIPTSVKGRIFNIMLSDQNIIEFSDSAVVVVSLPDMHDFVVDGTNDLFASNVRQYLRNTRVNLEIRKTIETTPGQFWLYNNGITIVCDDFHLSDDSSCMFVRTPQIVNGCQTAQSIKETLSKFNEKERINIRGYVLVRIIKGADDKQRENITRFTNTQNAVKGKDFFSLEEFQKKLHGKLKVLGYFYERQKGAFTSLKSSEKAKFRGASALSYLVNETKFNNRIQAMEATQSYAAAFVQIPHVAYGQPYELAPSGSHYGSIFDDNTPISAEYFLYPFLVREYAKNHEYSRGGEAWRAHGSLFFVYTYFLTCVELFKSVGAIDKLLNKPPKEIPLEVWKLLFEDANLNTTILLLTDSILEEYFRDSKVTEAVGVDVRKFLKSAEQLEKHKGILISKIQLTINSTKNKQLVQQLSALLRG